MITFCVSVEEGAVSRRVRVTAASMERAVRIAGGGEPGREIVPVFPIDPEPFFAPEGAAERVEYLTGGRPVRRGGGRRVEPARQARNRSATPSDTAMALRCP